MLYIVQPIRGATMQTVNISDLRTNLLKYLEKANSGEQISVTANGKLIATIAPPINQKQLAQQQLEQLAKTATLVDIVTPISAEWDANLWYFSMRALLTAKALSAINKADEFNALIVSDITIWEIAMLVHKQRIKIDTTPSNFVNLYLQTRSISVIQISPEIAELSVNFGPEIGKDPADRIISATSIIQNAQLVTADQNLISSEIVDTLWWCCDALRSQHNAPAC